MTARNVFIFIILSALASFFLYTSSFHSSASTPIPDLDIPLTLITERAKALASHSWEYGTLAEALLELHNPTLAVFSRAAFPADKVPPRPPWLDVQGLEYAQHFIDVGEASATLADGDASAADSAALGVAAVMIGQVDVAFLKAAQRQLDVLRNRTPRLDNGAISHINDETEAWANFVAVVPPFFAYYAVVSSDLALLDEAVEQVRLYRALLRDERSGLWRHVYGPRDEDSGFWSTGCGWAAMGMARTAATIRNWSPAASREKARGWNILVTWVKEIVDAVIASDDDKSGLLRNYLDDTDYFGDTSGSALMAATVYRMAVLEPNMFGKKYVQWAEKKTTAVMEQVDHHNGIVAFAANPIESTSRIPMVTGSSEGQSFILMLYAARLDYLEWKKTS